MEECPHLRKCPFCHHDAEVVTSMRGREVHAHGVACTRCPMATPWRPTLKEATAIWNRRPEP